VTNKVKIRMNLGQISLEERKHSSGCQKVLLGAKLKSAQMLSGLHFTHSPTNLKAE
jgi:hypothetical protein